MIRSWRKKGLALLCIVMLASSLAACGGKKPAESNPSNGEEINESSNKISAKEREVVVSLPEHPNQPIKNFAIIQEEIFKRTNIKIKFETVPQSNYADKKKTLLATNNLPDIIQIDMSDINSFSSLGVFVPLMPYMEKGMLPNFQKFWDEYTDMVKLTAEGELYGFPAIGRNELKNGFGPVIRTDLLEKHNLAIPTTFDELLDVLVELKEIYPDSTPFAVRKGSGPMHQIFKTMAYSLGSGVGTGNGIYFDKDKNGGEYVFGPATEQFKEVLAFFQKAYELGVLDPDYAVASQQQWTEKLASGKSFFFFDNSGFALDYTKQLQQAVPEGKFELIPIPMNQTGEARAVFYETTLSPSRLFAISTRAKDPDTLVKLLDWMYTEEASNLMNYGIEGVHHTLDAQGNPQLNAEFVSKFKESQPTAFYAMYSELGSGKLNFTPWFANMDPQVQVERLLGTWSEQHDKYWQTIADDPAYHDPVIDPPLTKEETNRVKDVLVPLSTMLEQEYDKFIMGVKPIDEYDAVLQKARENGGEEIEEIYNGALARLNEQMGAR